MKCTVKIGIIPKGRKCRFEVREFIEKLAKNKDIETDFNDMSTSLTGDYHRIMDILVNEFYNVCIAHQTCRFAYTTEIEFHQTEQPVEVA